MTTSPNVGWVTPVPSASHVRYCAANSSPHTVVEDLGPLVVGISTTHVTVLELKQAAVLYVELAGGNVNLPVVGIELPTVVGNIRSVRAVAFTPRCQYTAKASPGPFAEPYQMWSRPVGDGVVSRFFSHLITGEVVCGCGKALPTFAAWGIHTGEAPFPSRDYMRYDPHKRVHVPGPYFPPPTLVPTRPAPFNPRDLAARLATLVK